MAELKRDILEYERSTGQRFLNLRRLFNSAMEGGAKRKREDDSQEGSSKKTRNENAIVFKTASGVDEVVKNWVGKIRLFQKQITSIPPEIGNLTKMTKLNLLLNQITTIPPEIGNLANLKTLVLTDNRLTSIPPEIGNLAKLTFLF